MNKEKKKITKTIIFKLKQEEYDTIANTVRKNQETIATLYPPTEEFFRRMYKFLPEKTPAGTYANIEILVVKIPENEPKTYCHLNIIESNGFNFARILHNEDINKSTNKPKTYKNDYFSCEYEVKFL